MSFKHAFKKNRKCAFFARNLYDFHTMPLHFELSGFWLENDESAMKLVPCKGSLSRRLIPAGNYFNLLVRLSNWI